MGKVVMYSSVSVDGFIADENDQPGPDRRASHHATSDYILNCESPLTPLQEDQYPDIKPEPMSDPMDYRNKTGNRAFC